MLTSIEIDREDAPTPTRGSNECRLCAGRIVDGGEEFVCSSCGVVIPKGDSDLGSTWSSLPQTTDYSASALGSFLGPAEVGYDEIFSKGLSKSGSTFRYLKTISDSSCTKEEGPLYSCVRLIERVCEKLSLPRAVMGEAASIAKEVISLKSERGGFTIASLSAYSVIASCKIRGVTSVSVKAVLDMYRDLGYRVKTSMIIQISIDSPVRIGPRRPEDYLGAVLARLPTVPLSSGVPLPPGYLKRLHRTARVCLEAVDVPSRGGHNPRALAATAVYAAEVAMASIESRRRILSQRDTAACADVAEYTVREQYVEIFKDRSDALCALVSSKESPSPEGSSRTTHSPLQSLARSN